MEWGVILPEIDSVQKFLQTKGLEIDQTVIAIQSLQAFLTDERDRCVENAVSWAEAVCTQMDIPIESGVRRKRRMDGKTTRDVGLTVEEEIRLEMFEIIDRLQAEITDRFQNLRYLYNEFGFIFLPVLLDKSKDIEIDQRIDIITGKYNEIDGTEVKSEVRRLRRLLTLPDCTKRNDENITDISTSSSVMDLFQWIIKWGFTEMMPNITVLLRIFFNNVC